MPHMFDGLTCVVTGGTGALGSAVVAHVLREGGRCTIPVYLDTELKRFEFADHDRVTIATGVDMGDEASATSFYDSVTSDGSLWATFNIAGGFAMSNICDTPLEDVNAMLRKNTLTAFLSCRESVRAMRESGHDGGRIVNVGARPAVEPVGGMLAYQISKAAVTSLTQGLAQEVKEDGILVNAVLPSIMNTYANRQAMPDADHDAWPTVEQVASAMVWLASKDNALTTGALVPVYGKM